MKDLDTLHGNERCSSSIIICTKWKFLIPWKTMKDVLTSIDTTMEDLDPGARKRGICCSTYLDRDELLH